MGGNSAIARKVTAVKITRPGLAIAVLLGLTAVSGCTSSLRSDAITQGDGGLEVCVPAPEAGDQIVAGVTFASNLAQGESVTFEGLEVEGVDGVELVEAYLITDPDKFLISSEVDDFAATGDGITPLAGASVAAGQDYVGVAATLALDPGLDTRYVEDFTVRFTDSSGRHGDAAAGVSFTFTPDCS